MFNKKNIRPMLLQGIEKPFQDNEYLYELKYDGIRALLYVSKKSINLITRNGIDITHLYPELNSIKNLVGNKKVIFDGEIVAFKENKPSFSELQKRNHLKNESKINAYTKIIPVAFIAFDIIYESKDLTNLVLTKRKEILNDYPDTEVFIKSKIYEQGIKLFEKVKKLGLEGIIAKKKNSLYYPNTRVYEWLKIKNFKKEEFYIHGYIKNKEKISLLLGEYKNKDFYYVGKVSIMPDDPLIKSALKQKKTNNLFVNHNEKATYITPSNKVLVNYMERTNSNHLRQPFVHR